MIPTKPATLYQRVQILPLHTSGSKLVLLLNRDGTWRVPPFLMTNLDGATTHVTPDLTQPTRGAK